MIQTRVVFAILFALFFCPKKTFAQLNIGHEVGIVAGPAGFFTDYGERWNVKNNLENGGFGVGLIYYLNFAYRPKCSCRSNKSFFSKYFKIRSEIDYFQSRLEHFGPVADSDSEGGRQLRAMHGKTQLIQFGAALEYHPLGIREFRDFATLFAPFIGVGVHAVHFNPTAYSDLGDFDSPKVLFRTFEGGLDLTRGTTFAIVGNAGVRYRIGRNSDLMVEGKLQYYNSDYIDGLDVQGPQNKFNDFVMWVNLGYVYYLNF